MSFDFEAIKEWVVCPKTHAPLVMHGERLLSCDPESRLAYPIRDGIPILLVDDAEPIDKDEWTAVMQASGRDENGQVVNNA